MSRTIRARHERSFLRWFAHRRDIDSDSPSAGGCRQHRAGILDQWPAHGV